MKQLIEAIVHALVDKPEEVQIKEVIGEHAHVLELRVAKEDLGKVIGKGGGARFRYSHADGGSEWEGEEALHPRDHRVLIRVTGTHSEVRFRTPRCGAAPM